MTSSKDRFFKVKLMVGIAQLVELWIVIPAVVGSSPIVHPNFFFPKPSLATLKSYHGDHLACWKENHFIPLYPFSSQCCWLSAA